MSASKEAFAQAFNLDPADSNPTVQYDLAIWERAWQEATRLAMDRAIEAVEFEKVEAEETKHPIDYAYNKALDHAKDGIRSALSGLNSTTSGEDRHG